MNKVPLVELRHTTLQIVDGDRGANYPSKTEFRKDGFCVFLNTNNVTRSGFDFSKVDFITQERDELLRKGKARVNDIILTTRGTVGNAAFYGHDVPYKNIRINSGMLLLRADQKTIEPYYLYAFLRSFVFRKQVISNGSGSAQPQLPITALLNISLPLPTFGEQRRIAAVLSALDAKIDLNHRINAELEALAKTIYDYWFVQFDFPDAHGRPYKSSGGAMVWNDTLKREIPAGWGHALLGNIVDVLDSKRVPLSKQQRESRPGSIPYYGATGIFGFIDDFLFDEELLLLAEDGSVMDERGKVVLQRIWGKSWVNNHAHVLRPRKGWTVELLYLMLRETPAIQMMSGSIQKKITQENLNATRVLVAPDPIRKSLTSVLMVLRDRQKLASEESAELTQLRDWLLPLLMNGQVRVA